ncbi:MAG: ATP-dependent helicase [Chloroflexi bacterium]|nr:ATP-dependent helicase [Chloroflexota bacterium]
MHSAVALRLAGLAPDQRAAATAPPGPVLCVAPAGSGKTTTLVARIAWLVDGGAAPGTITALTFNKRAAEELTARLAAALPAGTEPVRVRTFHALGLEILRGAGEPVSPLIDRETAIRTILPLATDAEIRRLDTVFSRLKLDLDVTAGDVAADPEAGPIARAFVAYEAAIAAAGGLDFDDLVARALHLLEGRPEVLAEWRERCTNLLVDEAQDPDRMQLRMALLLAAPANRIFLVGDDDQSIYGWRLADVRRLLGLAETSLPGLRRVDLETNYRCPEVVIERAVRLVEHNEERFSKVIRARPGAVGRLVLAPTRLDAMDGIIAVLRSWPDDDGTRAVLARTNRELLPAVAACLALDVPFAARDIELPVEHPDLDRLLDRAASDLGPAGPLLVRLSRAGGDPELRSAVLAWAPPFGSFEELRAAIELTRARLDRLRRDDAVLTLATAHGTKGLEFDHVAVIGLDEGRFPSARSIAEAEDPARALEEERRLAYVAWTRARRSLTLVYDPDAPSAFLREAFDPGELGATA